MTVETNQEIIIITLDGLLDELLWKTAQLSACERVGSYLHKTVARGASDKWKRASFRILTRQRQLNDDIADLLAIIEQTEDIKRVETGQG